MPKSRMMGAGILTVFEDRDNGPTVLQFTANQATITPSITLSAGAPTPAWTVTESDGTEYTYSTASFTHNRTVAGDMTIELTNTPAIGSYVTQVNLSNDGLKGTWGAEQLGLLPNLERLYLNSNSALNCTFGLADLPSSMIHIYLYSTISTITGSLADLPSGIKEVWIHVTSSTITGSLADLPATLENLRLSSTSSTITGSLSDLPAGLLYLYLYSTSSTITGGASAMAATNIVEILLQNTGLTQSQVDSIADRIWADRALFNTASHTINVGGSNAAPSGTYAAACPPTTGKEKIYELVNDSCGGGFNLWTWTYTA